MEWTVAAVFVSAVTVILIAALNFPYDFDKPLSAEELAKNRQYYAEAYRAGTPSSEQPLSAYETKYIRVGAEAAEAFRINEQVANFVDKYGLRNGAMLDIGSGRGYLQDAVADYTGLDISSNVSRFYHKKFVLGSATAMPFPDGSFDGGWSIWVLEHVPNPEQALAETRRVMKNGAVFFLFPAWNCTSWAADGYDVRPYSDFGVSGKLIKASTALRRSSLFNAAGRVPVRILRDGVSRLGPTRLRYRLLKPNYQEYWEPDSDAVNSIDRREAMLWFRSRGDECLNCNGSILRSAYLPLIIRIHK